MPDKPLQVGFIGIGAMGAPMCDNLLEGRLPAYGV